MKRGDRGPFERDFQLGLIALGFPLPRYGADGDIGTETIEAAEAWAYGQHATDQAKDFVDEIPKAVVDTVNRLHKVLEDVRQDAFDRRPFLSDYREEASKAVEHGRNHLDRIDTICLHQMACKDSDDQGVDRWRKLAIHWAVTCGDNAKAYLMHDLDTYLYHGHGWNRRSVGFEFEGYFSGIGENPRYLWSPRGSHRKPMVPTPQQISAGRNAVAWTVEKIASMGGKIQFIGAHRQSYATKESDPGSLIWQEIALWAQNNLGLKEAPTLPKGSPIPEVWDSRNEGVPYR